MPLCLSSKCTDWHKLPQWITILETKLFDLERNWEVGPGKSMPPVSPKSSIHWYNLGAKFKALHPHGTNGASSSTPDLWKIAKVPIMEKSRSGLPLPLHLETGIHQYYRKWNQPSTTGVGTWTKPKWLWQRGKPEAKNLEQQIGKGVRPS